MYRFIARNSGLMFQSDVNPGPICIAPGPRKARMAPPDERYRNVTRITPTFPNRINPSGSAPNHILRDVLTYIHMYVSHCF